MSPNKLEVRRTTYGLFDVLTELGGLIKIVQIAANVLVTPISRFLYFLVMIKRLFLVETDTDVAFRNDHHESHRSEQPGGRGKYLDIRQIPADLEGTGFEDDVTRHKQIQMSTWDKLMLFLYISLPCLQKCGCWSKRKHYVRLYKRGMDRSIKNMNVLNLIKRLNKVTMLTLQNGKIT